MAMVGIEELATALEKHISYWILANSSRKKRSFTRVSRVGVSSLARDLYCVGKGFRTGFLFDHIPVDYACLQYCLEKCSHVI